ncbi:tRNA pseudouridine(38-40) synthase TruA [Mariniblastus fucicola]|uniref:tRNA pseudouridine synthase A n=1 Tax=Mariniblastus fucicola TaxID=980251 RepID=A0A5B9PGB7_9BACT|nr:tRNA pseudouridine(38-40) synthase TruA [Mariniblastus fucicola]QEG24275.1 tRNA pseudouridine synthase A [Mariniblastus fucicola]
MRHLKLTVAYEGRNFVGWQVQKNGISVQQRLEEGWAEVTGEKIRITASGRTDSGVHARGQVCSLATNSRLPNRDLIRALNAKTPEDVSVLKVESAIDGFHAINHCVKKTYSYQIQCGRILDPLGQDHWWFVPHHLDIAAMKEAAAFLTGKLDFASFQASGGVARQTTVRNVLELRIETAEREPFTEVRIFLTADGFLYNMVRNIVGTLVHVGRRSERPEWVKWVLQQKDRTVAGQTAPANGLFLDEVFYPPETVVPESIQHG